MQAFCPPRGLDVHSEFIFQVQLIRPPRKKKEKKERKKSIYDLDMC